MTATDSDHWVNEDTNEEGTEYDELVYNWSVSGGWISGFGPSILWTPPNVTGTYTITCTVDDRPLFIGPHDKGTRNDEMVIKSIQVQVPPRVWDDGAPIGRMLDEDGVEMVDENDNPRENGRIIAPQDTTQDPARPVLVKVRPGGVLSCAVEAASDWDHWSRGEEFAPETGANRGQTHGDEEDKVLYTWTASGGSFTDNSRQNTKWLAPDGPTAPGEYTLTCTMTDQPLAVVAPDEGERNDDESLVRTIKVHVVDDTSWAELNVYRDDNGEPAAAPADGAVGGKVWIVLDVQVGGFSKIASPATAWIRVEERDGLGLHSEADNHAWFAVNFGAGSWQKWDFETEEWKASSETPLVENSEHEPKRYRYQVPWQTTTPIESPDPDGEAAPLQAGKLWGHNAMHTLQMQYSAEKPGGGYEIKDAVEFQTKNEDNDYDPPRASGPNNAGANVQNLVITDVVGNAGNADYIKFNSASDNPTIAQPKFNFTLQDSDPHRYKWYIHIRDTQTKDWAVISGESQQTGPVPPVSWNGLQLDGTPAPAGTYSFDIHVIEYQTTLAEPLDEVWLKMPYQLKILDKMPDEFVGGVQRDGHYVEFAEDEASGEMKLYGGYYLQDEQNMDAAAVTIHVLDSQWNLKPVVTRTGEDARQGKAYTDIELFSGDASELVGESIIVFMAEDGHARQQRDHENKRMLAVNKRPKTLPFHIEDDWMVYGYKTGYPTDWPTGPISPGAHLDELSRGKKVRGSFYEAGWLARNATKNPAYISKQWTTQVPLTTFPPPTDPALLNADGSVKDDNYFERLFNDFSKDDGRFHYYDIAQSQQYVHVIYAWTPTGDIHNGIMGTSTRTWYGRTERFSYIFIARTFERSKELVSKTNRSYFDADHTAFVVLTTVHELGHQFLPGHNEDARDHQNGLPENQPENGQEPPSNFYISRPELDAVKKADVDKLWWWRYSAVRKPQYVWQFKKCVFVPGLGEIWKNGSRHYCPIHRVMIRHYDWLQPDVMIDPTGSEYGIPASVFEDH